LVFLKRKKEIAEDWYAADEIQRARQEEDVALQLLAQKLDCHLLVRTLLRILLVCPLDSPTWA